MDRGCVLSDETLRSRLGLGPQGSRDDARIAEKAIEVSEAALWFEKVLMEHGQQFLCVSREWPRRRIERYGVSTQVSKE